MGTPNHYYDGAYHHESRQRSSGTPRQGLPCVAVDRFGNRYEAVLELQEDGGVALVAAGTCVFRGPCTVFTRLEVSWTDSPWWLSRDGAAPTAHARRRPELVAALLAGWNVFDPSRGCTWTGHSPALRPSSPE